MGDVHAGDIVLSGEGTPTEVLSVFPQGKRPVYAIGLDDGTEFEVWISDDRNKIPLYIKSPIKVGSVQAYLTSYEGLRYPLDSFIKK